ncbi:hypothetical protein [Mycobacterium sp.]|uniref:hypothetical protein n=1 Tax=Mycobacterium sp. TaxID=1785 RepID=UPI0031D99311
MSRRSSRLAVLSGLALAGVSVSHFASPQLFDPITRPVFPRNTRQHILTNGGIETAIGLGLSVRKTRGLAAVGLLGYLAYLGGNAVRNAQTL